LSSTATVTYAAPSVATMQVLSGEGSTKPVQSSASCGSSRERSVAEKGVGFGTAAPPPLRVGGIGSGGAAYRGSYEQLGGFGAGVERHSRRPVEVAARLASAVGGMRKRLEELMLGGTASWSDGQKWGCAAMATFAMLALCGLSTLLLGTAPVGQSSHQAYQYTTPASIWVDAGAKRSRQQLPQAASAAEQLQLLPWAEAELKATKVEAQLTQEERLALLAGGGGNPAVLGYYVGNTVAVPRLGIPALKMQDASAGFRPTNPHEEGTTTCWPSMLTLASTWDEEVVGRVASAIAREFRGKGSNVILGPGVNVHRTARGGRNFEYLSGEDPYLGSRLASAYVRAVQSLGVMATVKHFAFNEQETARRDESSNVDVTTAWELYYPPFEAALKAGAGAVMCAYNRVNGVYSCENEDLLRRDLKGTMGFAGFVMSDWTATHSTRAVVKGLDLEMPTPDFFRSERLKTLGSKDQEALHEAARRILTSIYHLRLDEHKGCELPCVEERKSNQRTEAHLELAAQAAAAGVVLLKNDGVLPLGSGHVNVRRLAVVGPAAAAADNPDTWQGSPYAGGGSGHVVAPEVSSPLRAIRTRADRAGISVVVPNASASAADPRAAAEAATRADVVVVVASATAAEGADRATLTLDQSADAIIFAVSKVRPTVVLLQVPGAVLTPWRGSAAAVACLFLGGEQTGRAWASLLFGDAEPRGRLPLAMPASDADTIVPIPPQGPTDLDLDYKERLFTSYRNPSLRAAFPFGHGLAFTRFSFGEPRSWSDGCLAAACVRLTVSNVGQRRGSEVAQAYVSLGQGKPKLALRGFRRTRELSPGEEEELLFSFTARDLSTYNAQAGRWQQKEHADVHVGPSSGDIRHVLRVQAARLMPVAAA